MPNIYFQFKQFTVYQDQCAMKVSTDSCILGAWFASKISDYTYVLDIGSGTGLLMLMLAQKLKSQIHGIEIDLDCFKQLKENIAHNNWKDKCRVFIGDVRSFHFPNRYDFIISNPPFHENQLETGDEQKDLARHSSRLSLRELVVSIESNLSSDGGFGVLLPAHRVREFEEMCTRYNFFLSEKLLVKQSRKHDVFRGIMHFTRKKVQPIQTYQLSIKDEQDNYTPEFKELLKDYYLNF